MGGRTEPKLNRLLQNWPKGTVATQAWLEGRGIYRQLTRRYLSSGWIERLGRGAFVRAGDDVDWLGAVYALQNQLKLTVRVGGLTALELKGFGQYPSLGRGAHGHLFSDKREHLASWFVRHRWPVRIVYHCSHLFQSLTGMGITDLDRGNFQVRASSPERAILEVLHLATTNAAVDHAIELFAGLTTLRPKVVQSLLETCVSIKVRRLFLWAAENSGHKWFDRIDTKKVNLGRGKRALYKGGRLDRNYQITVPSLERLPDV